MTGTTPIDTIIQGDCLEVMKEIPDNHIDLILTDPPYYKVKSEAWDNQWDTPAKFLEWIGQLCQEWQRILKPNGSLYCFASPKMAARVECKIGEYFEVLNRITWRKPPFSTKAEMFRKEDCRGFFPASEAIIFAEPFQGDRAAMETSGYNSKREAVKVDIFGKYLDDEITRAGFNHKQIAALFPSKTGGLTGCVSNWVLGLNCPTREQYYTIREYLNSRGKEPEYLKREYEDLRRPFSVTAEVPYTDVWDFPTVQYHEGKHPCEKPIEMTRHIIAASSRPGALVLDCFGGSCKVADACIQLGRRYLIIEKEQEYVRIANKRVMSIQPEAARRRIAAVPARLDRWAEAEG